MDENNEAYFGEIKVVFDHEKHFNNQFIPLEISIVQVASGELVEKRGNIHYLMLAILSMIVLAIDIIFPDLFFYISHGLYTKDAQPSELYRAFQYLGRIVSAVLVVLLLLISVS